MNVQETLAQIDHAITEIDLALHEWQEGLDMMSFIYVDVSFELWTNDDPPRLVTAAVLAQTAGKELRVMHIIEGKPTQVGTAVVNSNGILEASITKEVPGLTDAGPMSFSVDREDIWKPLPSERALLNPPFEGFGIQWIKEKTNDAIMAHRDHFREEHRKHLERIDIENHPFFKKEQN